MVDQSQIHRKVSSKWFGERMEAARLFRGAFAVMQEKSQAWLDLHWLTQDEDGFVRASAADALGSAFSLVPDKDQAWLDLHWLTQDEDSNVRWSAADAIGLTFSRVPKKDQAWKDLVRLTQDEDGFVRASAADALGSAFSLVPDKDQAWKDLQRLTQDENSDVRWSAVNALGSAFSAVPNKDQAWEVLYELTQDEDSDVRASASDTLGSAFSVVPNKDQAWEVLQRLTQDENSDVRWSAVNALGSVFSAVPNKDQAWEVLQRLTQDENSDVRMYAHHSLGRASVYRATESGDMNVLRMYLGEALGYFEKSSQESKFSPAKFCHPFYCSYFAITFQGGSQESVQKYLAEAREAVGWSKSKDELLKAVENLAGALQEAQRLKNRPLSEVLRDLKTYEWYCTQAEKHMISVEDKVPGAVNLMRRCNPLIKESIETIIHEIQDIAGQICQETHDKGPGAKAFCGQIKEAAGSLSGKDMIETLHTVSAFVSILKEKCKLLPEDERELIQDQLDGIDRTSSIPEKLDCLKKVVGFFLSRIQRDAYLLKKLDEIHVEIKSLRQSLLDRFEFSERKILSSVFERLDRDKLEIVEALLNVIERNAIPKDLISDTLNATKDLVSEIKARQIEIRDPEAAKSLNSWEDAINSPELGIENSIKITIPIIPLLLTYEGSYKFQNGIKLDSAWNKLRALIRR